MVFRYRAVRIGVISSITAATIYVAGGLYGALFMTHLPLDRGNCVTVVNSERNDGSLTQRLRWYSVKR